MNMQDVTMLGNLDEMTDFIMNYDGQLTTRMNKVFDGGRLVAMYLKK